MLSISFLSNNGDIALFLGPAGAYRALAACYAHMGRIDEARKVIARLRTITPRVMPKLSRLSNPAHRELYLSGLRLAAGEGQ